MQRTAWASATALTAWLAAPAHAINVEKIDVRYESGFYKVELIAELEAEPQAVARVLTDYAHYSSLDARIQESRLVETNPGEPTRLYTRLRGCVGSIFCRSMVRVEILQLGEGELVATAVPDLSDVRESVTHTQWQAGAKGTIVTYALTLDPKFWVPALFARKAMIETMRSGTVAMFTSVERVARELPPASNGNQ